MFKLAITLMRETMAAGDTPDGKSIVFTSNRDGNYEIYVMSLSVRQPLRITHNPERDDYPAWHPDGDIAYVAEEAGRFDIHLINPAE